VSKQAAISFVTRAASGRVREAFDTLVTPGFRHHNAYFPSDAASLARAMEENARANPAKALEVKQAIEEGDRVVLLSEVHHKPGDRGAAVVHIFRFEGDRIAELWDVGQEVPADAKNELGMF